MLPEAEVCSGPESGVCLTWLNPEVFLCPHAAPARSQRQAGGCWKTPWPHQCRLKAGSKAGYNDYLNQVNCAFGSYLSTGFGHRWVTSVKQLISATEHFWAEHPSVRASGVQGLPCPQGWHTSLSGPFLGACLGRNRDANVGQPKEEWAVGNHCSNPGNQFSPLQSYAEGCTTAYHGSWGVVFLPKESTSTGLGFDHVHKSHFNSRSYSSQDLKRWRRFIQYTSEAFAICQRLHTT